MTQVRAEYDFEAQPNSGEMSIVAGEVLTVIRENIDGGWMEGRNVRGSVGLFPESYVLPYVASRAPPPMAPPAPPPSSFVAMPSSHSSRLDDWGESSYIPPASKPQPIPQQQGAGGNQTAYSSSQKDDDFDDEWTDEDEEQNEHRLSVHDPTNITNNHLMIQQKACGSRSDIMSTDDETRSSSQDFRRNGHRRKSRHEESMRRRKSEERESRRRIEKSHTCELHREPSTKQSSVSNFNTRREISRSHSEHGGDRAGSNKVNKSINRFSNFVKSGMEAYVIGDAKLTTQPSEKHEIVVLNGVIQWKPIQKYYNCVVDKPKKESKLKGLKSFIAYSITSSLTNIQVSRRYKHFDWLHEQLSAKYVLIPIPPLPEKQVAGRYEEDLIDHRKHILQLWVNKICRHPVLSQSEVWLHFISCTDEKDWKSGKRRAEKDEYVGGNFLNCVSAPAQNLEQNSVDHQVERFQRSVKTSEEAMRTMQERMLIFQKAFAGPVKLNWQKMGGAFKTLQQSFEIDDTSSSRKLTDALAHTASEYFEIGQLFDAHTKNDMEPVLENLYSYKGTVQNVPDILHVHKQAIQKFRESEGRLSATESEKMRQRIDTLSYAVIAEIQHQTQEKVEEMNTTMGTYLKRQAAFYQDVAQKMSNLSSKYENLQ